MKRRMVRRIALTLAVLSMSAFFALADAPVAVEADTDGIELEGNGQVGYPVDGDLILDGDALFLDDGIEEGLVLDGLLDLQLDVNALLSMTDEAVLDLEAAAVDSNDGLQANIYEVTDSVTASGGMDNDALFEAWLKKMLPGKTPKRTLRPAYSGRAMLSGVNLKLYDALVPMIREVAEGKRTSTEFLISADDVDMGAWWTAEQLGLANFDDRTATINALLSKAGFTSGKILQALLMDCPYELYWFDKVKGGMGWGVGVKIQDGKARLSSMTAKMAVAADYSRTSEIGSYEVNDLPARVSDAVSNIEGIVADYADRDDLSKLKAYANEICRLVAYNKDAASSDTTPYGDPWQLVYIFDGDDSTNVVCEGYSKGFKYLCDLSDFDADVACELMSGSIHTGKHMWNALRMPDGRVYLVDVTNSDGGDACNEKFFLKGCRNQTDTAFTCGTLTYTYNENTLANFSSAWLTMSPFNYGDKYTVEGFNGAYDGIAHGVSVLLNGEGTISYGTEKGVYDSSESPVWKDAGTYTVYFLVKMADAGAMEDRAEVNIAPKTVRLKWSGTSLTYNGETQAPTAEATGLVSGDACKVTVSGGKKKAGSYTATATALSNGNYALPESATQAFTVAPKTVGLKWSKTSLTYNGETQAPTAEATGLVSGDACKVTVSGGKKKAGSYTATATALSNGNYALPESASRAFTVAPKTVRLKWSKTSLTYNGKVQKPTAEVVGLVLGDECTVKVTGGQKNAGSYMATATALSNRNYALPESATRTFTVAPKTVGLKWTKTSLTYNGEIQRPAVKATGLVSGDRCTVTVTGGRRNAGSYKAKATRLSNANYVLPKARTKTCTIRKKTVRLKWIGTVLKYNGKLQKPTATAIGLIKDDKCTVRVKGAHRKRGVYSARAIALSNRNYQLPSKVTINFRIY